METFFMHFYDFSGYKQARAKNSIGLESAQSEHSNNTHNPYIIDKKN